MKRYKTLICGNSTSANFSEVASLQFFKFKESVENIQYTKFSCK